MLGLVAVLVALVVIATVVGVTTNVVRRARVRRMIGTAHPQPVDGVKPMKSGFPHGVDHRHGAHGQGAYLQAGNAFVHGGGSVDDQPGSGH